MKNPRIAFSDRGSLPIAPAVYAVMCGDEPIYIGQTEKLKKRIRENVKRFKEQRATEIRFIYCRDFLARYRIETYLLNRYKPIMNTALNSTSCQSGVYPIAPRVAKFLGLPQN